MILSHGEGVALWAEKVRNLGKNRVPFFFMVDFEMLRPLCFPLHQMPGNIRYLFHSTCSTTNSVKLHFDQISFVEYKAGFDIVQKHLKRGDSYLVNYTVETPVDCDFTLGEIFQSAVAPYKVLVDGQFVAFSPESFIKITERGVISTYPMKGTIDASLPDASKRLLSDEKEAAEHATTVDLLRNDLSMVASNVTVDRYRYLQQIVTHDITLLQASSCITGELDGYWNERIDEIIVNMLPAGSVTGAPKPRTIDVIRCAETHRRGYYTGVFGVYDGKTLDSAVAIRYIEQRDDKKFFKSGGGITAKSSILDEYNEVKQKIYVPIG